ncbi:MAG TPA: DnaJ domain-containing protein [Candidatus Nanoarchaeia archaeon]|nr:DnaJ domain-containing protein [Candidatus Nanoarchaeia archaeon]
MKVEIKGHEFEAITVKDSFQRRAVQYKNNIIATLSKIGLTEDDSEIELEHVSIKRSPASASWYYNGYHLHYSYQGGKFVDNLYVVWKVIEFEVSALLNKQKTVDEFIHEFSEDTDIAKQRKEARELLGVDANSTDMALIDKKYKELAKELHPDKPNGDTEKFKAVNRAHKILKRELE